MWLGSRDKKKRKEEESLVNRRKTTGEMSEQGRGWEDLNLKECREQGEKKKGRGRFPEKLKMNLLQNGPWVCVSAPVPQASCSCRGSLFNPRHPIKSSTFLLLLFHLIFRSWWILPLPPAAAAPEFSLTSCNCGSNGVRDNDHFSEIRVSFVWMFKRSALKHYNVGSCVRKVNLFLKKFIIFIVEVL